MRVETLDEPVEDWVRVVVARDAATADTWRDALEGAEIGAEVRLEDVLEALPGTSTLPGALPLPGMQGFAYGVYVPATAREAALRVLIDAGWNGRTGRTGSGAAADMRTLIGGAGVALAAAGVVIALRLVLG